MDFPRFIGHKKKKWSVELDDFSCKRMQTQNNFRPGDLAHEMRLNSLENNLRQMQVHVIYYGNS